MMMISHMKMVLQLARRAFSSAPLVRSNIGSAPIFVPKGTHFELTKRLLDDVTAMRLQLDKKRQGKPRIHVTQDIEVKGPKGLIKLGLADFVKFELSDDGKVATVSVEDPAAKHERSMWGTSRSLVANAVTGVNEGHLCIVKLVGTGFRATYDDTKREISLRVGYSDPRVVAVPEGIHVETPVPHRIILEGCDKQQVKLLAAEIRKFRKPEPYKGKGIFIDNETIRLKQKKIK